MWICDAAIVYTKMTSEGSSTGEWCDGIATCVVEENGMSMSVRLPMAGHNVQELRNKFLQHLDKLNVAFNGEDNWEHYKKIQAITDGCIAKEITQKVFLRTKAIKSFSEDCIDCREV